MCNPRHSGRQVSGTHRHKGPSSCLFKGFLPIGHALRHVGDDQTSFIYHRFRKRPGILREIGEGRVAFTGTESRPTQKQR